MLLSIQHDLPTHGWTLAYQGSIGAHLSNHDHNTRILTSKQRGTRRTNKVLDRASQLAPHASRLDHIHLVYALALKLNGPYGCGRIN